MMVISDASDEEDYDNEQTQKNKNFKNCGVWHQSLGQSTSATIGGSIGGRAHVGSRRVQVGGRIPHCLSKF